MRKVYIDKATQAVVGATAPSPLLLEIMVPEDFKLQKTVYEQDGEKQKTNDQGQPLFRKEVFRTDTINTVVGQDETIEDTGKPIMVKVHKTNNQGKPLYLEPIIDSEGNVVDYLESTKTVDDSGQYDLAPVWIEVQQTSVSGAPLYWKDVISTTYEEVLDHVEEVTEARETTAWEPKEIMVQEIVGYEKKLDPETGEPIEEDDLDRPIIEEVPKVIQEPTEFKEFEPIMVPNMLPKFITLWESPEHFTSEEVVTAKYTNMLEASGDQFICADEFFTEDEIDYNQPKLANTGAKLMELLPSGEVTFKPIALDAPTKTLHLELLELCGKCEGAKLLVNGVASEGAKLLVNGVASEGGVYHLPELTSEIIIKLTNPTDKRVMISAYALTYNEGV